MRRAMTLHRNKQIVIPRTTDISNSTIQLLYVKFKTQYLEYEFWDIGLIWCILVTGSWKPDIGSFYKLLAYKLLNALVIFNFEFT